MNKTLLIEVFKKEIEKSTGCTDPGAVTLAVAKATEVLGEKPDKIKVAVSPNLYKNGISVGVPGTGKRGLFQAAALGIYLYVMIIGWVLKYAYLSSMAHLQDRA